MLAVGLGYRGHHHAHAVVGNHLLPNVSGQTLNGDSPSVLPPCLAYTDAESVSLNVGFYYMANAARRLLGTLLSGGLFLVGGMQACLWASSLLVALAFLAGLRLPPPLRQELEAT